MSEDFNLDVTNTAGSWYGTQMKPEIFEPFTAEWGGRLAKNAGWLFARQDAVIYSEGQERSWVFEPDTLGWLTLFTIDFWLNEVWGTFTFRYFVALLGGDPSTDLVRTRAQLFSWQGNGGNEIGTQQGTGHNTTTGFGSLVVIPPPDWGKSASNNYARLVIDAATEPQYGRAVFSMCNLFATPRT